MDFPVAMINAYLVYGYILIYQFEYVYILVLDTLNLATWKILNKAIFL